MTLVLKLLIELIGLLIFYFINLIFLIFYNLLIGLKLI